MIPINLSGSYKLTKALIALIFASSILLGMGNSMDSIEEENTNAISSTKSIDINGSDYVVAPIPFSNPTLGTGLNVVGLYMHAKRDKESLTPTTAAVALYSSNNSWMAGIFHEDFWDHGKNRVKLGIGISELNLNYYGIGNNENVVEYTMKVAPVLARYQRQFLNDNLFLGLQYIGLFGKIKPQEEDRFLASQGDFSASALGLVATYDSRDDIYFPSSGIYSEGIYNNYSEALGSDFNAELLKLYSIFYFPHLKNSTFASKIEYKYNSSREPFFLLPSVSIRGFDKTKYIEQMVLQIQNEERYKFSSRFAAVVFFEAGIYGSEFSDFNRDSLIMSYGTGLRYQVIENKKINLAVDVAFSEEDSVIYLRLGEAF